MMDKWIKKLSGAFIASVLAFTLSSRAYADPEVEPVPDLPLPQYEEKASGASDTGSADVSYASDAKAEPVKADAGNAANNTPLSEPAASEKPAAENKAPAVDIKGAVTEANTSNIETTEPGSEINGSESKSKASVSALKDAEEKNEKPAVEAGSGDEGKGTGTSGNEAAVTKTAIAENTSAPEALTGTNENNEPGADKNRDEAVLLKGAPSHVDSFDAGSGEDDAGFARSAAPGTGKTDAVEQTPSLSANTDKESGVISFGSHEFKPGQSASFSEDDSIPPANEFDTGTTILWGYDAGNASDAADDTLYMVNYDASSLTLASTNSDINVTAAGFNRIRNINADGDVNLTGTGILLLDNVTLSEGHGFFLKPITEIYGTNGGSVAVFLRQSSSGTSSSSNAVYQLVNGSIPGILDESYTIPAGIDLVMPSGSSLELKSLVVTESKSDGSLTYFFDEVPAGYFSNQPGSLAESYNVTHNNSSLTIENGASLTVEGGALLKMSKIDMTTEDSHISLFAPKVNIHGNLTVNGSIDGEGDISLGNEAPSPAVLDGKGTIKADSFRVSFSSKIADNSNITFNCSKIDFFDCDNPGFSKISKINNFIFKNSVVMIRLPLTINNIKAIGDSTLIGDGQEFGNISVYKTGTLSLHSSGLTRGSTISGKVTGGTVRFLAGSYTFSASSSVSSGMKFSFTDEQGRECESFIYNYSGTNLSSFFDVTPSGIPRILNSNTILPSSGKIPYSFMYLLDRVEHNPGGQSAKHYLLSSSVTSGKSNGLYTTDSGNYIFSYDSLLSFMENNLAGSDNDQSEHATASFAVHYKTKTGALRTVFITSENPSITLAAGSVPVAVDGFYNSASSVVFPGNSINSPQTSSTGSGILGGGAGSITGGNGFQLILNPSVTPTPIDPSDPVDPPDPVNPPEIIQPNVPKENIVITVTEREASDTTSLHQSVSLEEAEPVYRLSVTVDGQQLTKPTEKITVRFKCPAPKSDKQIFAVFRNRDGSLKVFRAKYNIITGELVFETDMLGDFAVVCIDYKGELYSEEFYKYLETFEHVKSLS